MLFDLAVVECEGTSLALFREERKRLACDMLGHDAIIQNNQFVDLNA